jgi:hypothetical protein
MLMHRVALQIGDTFIEREQNSIGSKSAFTTAGSAAPRNPSS